MDILYWVIIVLLVALAGWYIRKLHVLQMAVDKKERDLAAEAERKRKELEERYRREPYAFNKIPVKVHAAQLMDIDEEDGIALASRTYGDQSWPDWFLQAFNKGDIQVGKKDNDPVLYVKTLEGEHVIRVGMWIICGVKGEIYGCQNEIFEETYE